MTATRTGQGTVGLAELAALLRSRALTSTDLLTWCLERIAALDPAVNAVTALDDTAFEQAARSDARHARDAALGPLDGVPVLVKDNIDTAGLATTAGSRVLGTPPARDAGIVTRLRGAGAVLLGKTNLSEWGNFRSAVSAEGWSAAGGQTRNPHRLDHSPWGSSAGSAAAVATGMAPLALGTETDGSIVGPAGMNGVTGVKPETGLLPTDGVVPISSAQDTVGLLTATAADAALALAALTGGPPPPSEAMPLTGRRLGLWHAPGLPARTLDEVGAALAAAGAQPVPVELDGCDELVMYELIALHAEFRPSLERYLRDRPGAPGTLADLIEAHRADPHETRRFGLEVFERAAAVTDGERREALAAGRAARARARELIAAALRRHGLDAVLAATNRPAWRIDHAAGDPPAPTSSTPAAMAGLPNVCVPAAFDGDLPLGVSVFGPRRLARLLPIADAVERACAARRAPKLIAHLPGGPHEH